MEKKAKPCVDCDKPLNARQQWGFYNNRKEGLIKPLCVCCLKRRGSGRKTNKLLFKKFYLA